MPCQGFPAMGHGRCHGDEGVNTLSRPIKDAMCVAMPSSAITGCAWTGYPILSSKIIQHPTGRMASPSGLVMTVGLSRVPIPVLGVGKCEYVSRQRLSDGDSDALTSFRGPLRSCPARSPYSWEKVVSRLFSPRGLPLLWQLNSEILIGVEGRLTTAQTTYSVSGCCQGISQCCHRCIFLNLST